MSTVPAIICCDLDGTLLTSQKEITHYTRQAIAEAEANGVRCSLISGRPPVMMGAYYKMLGLKTPIVANGGAITIDPTERVVLDEHHVPVEPALEYIDFCTEEGLDWALFAGGGAYFPVSDHRHAFYDEYNQLARTCGAPELVYRSGITRAQAIEILEQGVHRISAVQPTRRQMDALEDYFPNHPELTFVHSTRTSYDAFAPGVNKWNGILVVCKALGIDPRCVYAFGNDVNDIDMIRNAGRGFMVANSEPQLLACAGTLIGSNDADGVAHAIRSFVLQQSD